MFLTNGKDQFEDKQLELKGTYIKQTHIRMHAHTHAHARAVNEAYPVEESTGRGSLGVEWELSVYLLNVSSAPQGTRDCGRQKASKVLFLTSRSSLSCACVCGPVA